MFGVVDDPLLEGCTVTPRVLGALLLPAGAAKTAQLTTPTLAKDNTTAISRRISAPIVVVITGAVELISWVTIPGYSLGGLAILTRNGNLVREGDD